MKLATTATILLSVTSVVQAVPVAIHPHDDAELNARVSSSEKVVDGLLNDIPSLVPIPELEEESAQVSQPAFGYKIKYDRLPSSSDQSSLRTAARQRTYARYLERNKVEDAVRKKLAYRFKRQGIDPKRLPSVMTLRALHAKHGHSLSVDALHDLYTRGEAQMAQTSHGNGAGASSGVDLSLGLRRPGDAAAGTAPAPNTLKRKLSAELELRPPGAV